MSSVEISSSWPAASGILTCDIVNDVQSFDVDNINIEKCVNLAKSSEEEDRGEFTLKSDSLTEISGFLILTDCPRWEILGGLQYITSVQGTIIEGIEDMNVHKVKLLLNKSYSALTLRLPPSVKDCWLYSVQVLLKKCDISKSGNFNLQNVEELLGSNKRELSMNAENFKTLFESFNQINSSCVGKLPPGFDSKTLTSGHTNMQQSHNFLTQGHLQSYIDHKCEMMERRILNVIEEKDRIINTKLDKILNALDKDTLNE